MRTLRPGDKVRRKDSPSAPVLTFLARNGSYNRFQCEDYKGMDGPDDQGFVDLSDWDLSRKYERVAP